MLSVVPAAAAAESCIRVAAARDPVGNETKSIIQLSSRLKLNQSDS